MRTKGLRVIVLMLIVVWGCQKDELNNLNEKVEQEEKIDESEEITDSEDVEEGEEVGGSQGGGNVVEPEPSLYGSVSYQGRIPTVGSKVPTCKSGTPDKVLFVMTDSLGVTYNEAVPASENNGLVSTMTPAPMPYGKSTVEGIHLMKDNDTLYSLPHENNLELIRFADTTVPFDVQVTNDTELTGSAFCYTKEEIDVPNDALVDGGFGTQRLQTLWIDIQGECIDIITVTIDTYRVLEIYPFQDGLYDIPIPENYNRMDVRAYTPEFQGGANDFEVFTYGGIDIEGNALPKYNADSNLDTSDIVRFSYDCPEEGFSGEDDGF